MTENEHTLDPGSWTEKYGDYLFHYAMVRLSDEQLASDLVQDTFLAALKSKERFKGASTEKTWLTSILKRKIIDVYRKKSRTREATASEFGDTITDEELFRTEAPFRGHWREERGPHSHSLMPEGEIENEELRAIIEQCIALLPPGLAAAFVMKMVDEADSGEVCKELGITASNLWVMLHRARLRMRDCIETKWQGNER